MIEEQKVRAMNLKKRKEAVKLIERFWSFILFKKELIEKRK